MILLFISVALATPTHLPDTPKSFKTVKKHLYANIYQDHRETLYCSCAYSQVRVVDLASCEMETLTQERALDVEAEHIVSASEFGKSRECWSNGGRDNCLKVDENFRIFHNDLHNLAPAVGQVNGARSDNQHGIVEGEKREFGKCDFEVDNSEGMAEAAPEIRGFIARVYLYAFVIHGMSLTDERRIMYLNWHLEHPPNDWEVTRDSRIFMQQNNRNPFVGSNHE